MFCLAEPEFHACAHSAARLNSGRGAGGFDFDQPGGVTVDALVGAGVAGGWGGRRGPAYCFLVSETQAEEAMERLQIMETTDSGFDLAEHDLRLRGPGEYFGKRQSGMPDLRVARLTDVELIEEARSEATRILDEDPELEDPSHAALRENVSRLWDRLTSDVS